jgi:hypothetical protein
MNFYLAKKKKKKSHDPSVSPREFLANVLISYFSVSLSWSVKIGPSRHFLHPSPRSSEHLNSRKTSGLGRLLRNSLYFSIDLKPYFLSLWYQQNSVLPTAS